MGFAEQFRPETSGLRFDETGAPAVTYVGYAGPGQVDDPDKAVWAIKRITDDSAGNVEVTYAEGKFTNDFVWDDRATYTYA